MSLLQIEQLTKAFGSDTLFEPFSAQIAPGDRVALIGDNGVGKSTLLKMIAGDEAATSGAVRAIGEVRIAYLSQVARLHDEGTLRTALERPFAELRRIEATLRELEHAIAASHDPVDMHRYDDLLHRFEREGGYRIEARVRSALIGVGFAEDEFDKPVGILSGGEEARAALARVLVEEPDVLLLDEPTNHLDFAALDWLEDQLLGYSGALLLVSHDRHLLERVANRTWEIALGRVATYRVGYSQSREMRDEARARQLEAYEQQEETIEKYKDFIRRHKVGQKHRQAKDREKKLERIEKDRIERPRDAKRISLRIRTGTPSGKLVLSTKDLEVGFDAPLFGCPDIELYRGEKVAIIGPNGCGKTTLLKTIVGERPPLRGRVELGHNVHTATYSQTQEGLHGASSVLETILARSSLTIGEARGLLGAFLFSGDDVGKRASTLSGGERSRVALALLSLVEGNFLLFDEPTNHLDLASQEILERALVAYDGTIVLVSHDRALLEAVATQVWIVEGDRLTVHGHGYAEYRRRLREAENDPREAEDGAGEPAPKAPAKRPNVRPAGVPTGAGQERPARSSGRGSPKKKVDRYQVRRLNDTRAKLEAAIEGLEARMGEIEAELAEVSAAGDGERIGVLGAEHREIQVELAERYREWDALAEFPGVDG